MAKRLDVKFTCVFRNLWNPRGQSRTNRQMIIQEWADAMMRNKITGKEAHEALTYVCDNLSKPPSIADFLEKAKGSRKRPLAHRAYRALEKKDQGDFKREKSMKTAEHFLDEIYKNLHRDGDNNR
ncbi:hypothetical protein [Sansalvadorimonas verongulae]|uniref:hypothetical protein n=1 Tax=Sansalvadorimonas verongulae TaxID=2172824 RepID=UPI0012BCA7F1|nr:hypothetical protein [Sansalvadorimonas verongulae]MTI12087.1 hypothetical protein [Sansalvadorimonas verongulae]